MVAIDDASVRLGELTAIDGVSATVDRGQFVGVIGPNGAGKTTLLRAIAGAIVPDSGTVRVDGRDVHALPSRTASRLVAVVPQDSSLAFDFDVRDIVAMGRTPYHSRFGRADRADRRAVERAMERADVTSLADRPISEVSGGERQRVLLARALAQETPALLLDEPTASLDINHQVRTLELVSNLVREGKTAIAAIHDLELAARYCDELVLLDDGRTLASGPPEAVLTEGPLRAAFDARTVTSRHAVTGSIDVTTLPERSAGAAGGRVHVVGGGAAAARVLHSLAAAGYEVSVGPLGPGHAALEAARLLGVATVTAPPFAPVDERVCREVEGLIADADATVVADAAVGAGNLDALRAARSSDAVVLVEERPFGERNSAGDDARSIYEALRERGVVATPDSLLDAVGEAIGSDGRGAASEPHDTDRGRPVDEREEQRA